MARKYGKKNEIKIDPLAYNLGLFGESGIGKSSTIVEYCEALAGEDGYLLLNIGREDGVDAIPDAMYENIPDWETFEDFVDDVIANRHTEYKDLKVIAYDTIDELFRIAEPQVVRLHNLENPTKQVKSIKAAFGGYQAGEDKAIEIVIDKLWSLKDIGISMIVIGHTKRRTNTDVVTGEEYDMLTANMLQRYFNAIKTKLHALGVASIDRTIEKQKVKQKIGNDKTIGKVVDESRIITFRDDNFNIDSKSRFQEITPKINMNAKELVAAMQDAVQKAYERQRTKKSVEQVAQEQAVEKQKQVDEQLDKLKNNHVDEELNHNLVIEFKELYNLADDELKAEVAEFIAGEEISLKNYKEEPTAKLQKLVGLLK